jgi:cytochrome c oxidase assembly factor CtaG
LAHTLESSGREAGEWVLIALLFIAGAWFAAGYVRVWRSSRVGRRMLARRGALLAAGWLVLASSLLSPLHELGGRSFTAHMIEHEVLMVVAAPLLVVARPIGAVLWAFPANWRRASGAVAQMPALAAIWRWLTDPLIATVLHAVALWAWHVSALYEAALTSSRLHWLQHLSFFLTALLFWWSLLRGWARERGYGAAVMYLFATSLHTGFLGILLALARQPLYPAQTRTALEWGLTPLEDQQLAGLIMWVPAGLVYAAAALALAGVWIARSGLGGRGASHALAR